MNMKKLILSSVFLLVVLPSISFAQHMPGNELYGLCTDEDYQVAAGLQCIVYIQALRDGFDVLSAFLGRTNILCIPQEVTMGQVQDVVVEYLRRNAPIRQQPAASLTLLSLLEVWPCNQ